MDPAHDLAGNMTTLSQPEAPTGSFTGVYDAWNRLVELKDGAQTVAKYRYDGRGRRIVAETYSGGVLDETRHFYHSPQDQVIEERVDSSSDPDRQSVWGVRYVDELVLRDRDTDGNGTLDERLYALQDANFNVTALSDTSGAVVERYTYTPYGVRTILTGVWGSRASSLYGWTHFHQGLARDKESGLIYNRARTLHPLAGRFLQRDPLGYVDGANLHQYELSSPPDGRDPHGTYTIHSAVHKHCKEQCKHLKGNHEGRGPRLHCMTMCSGRLSGQEKFDLWYALEKTRGAWWEVLPRCPRSLCILPTPAGHIPRALNPDKKKWKQPKRPSSHEAILHPGAVWSMRSHAIQNHANQCTYDEDGNLLTAAPGAGTVDWVQPGGFLGGGHYAHDVEPVQYANRLDGGGDLDIQTPFPSGTMRVPPGPNVIKYYEVRPSWHE